MSAGWHRRPYGWLAEGGEFFVERGARMSDGGTAWLIWRRAADDQFEVDEYGAYSLANGQPLRTLAQITGAADGDAWYIDTHYEGASLAEAKDTAEWILEPSAR